MNLLKGNSGNLSQLGEGNFTPGSTFLSYLRRKRSKKPKTTKGNQNKTKIKVNREKGF